MYGIRGWENIDKPQMAEDIANGLWEKYGQPATFGYCEEDTGNTTECFRRMLRGLPGDYGGLASVNVPNVLYWSEYSSKVVASTSARHADRHAAVDFDPGKQGRNHLCITPSL
jgi:hypothetical protein